MPEVVGENLIIEVQSTPNVIEVQSTPNTIEVLRGGTYNFIQVGFNNYEQLNPAESTAFQLANVPVQPDKSLLFVNGVKAKFGTDYNVDGSILNWLSNLPFEPSDQVDFYYN